MSDEANFRSGYNCFSQICWSPDSESVAAICTLGRDEGVAVRTYDTNNSRNVITLTLSDQTIDQSDASPAQIGFNRRGDTFAVLQDNRLALFNTKSWKSSGQIDAQVPNPDKAIELALNVQMEVHQRALALGSSPEDLSAIKARTERQLISDQFASSFAFCDDDQSVFFGNSYGWTVVPLGGESQAIKFAFSEEKSRRRLTSNLVSPDGKLVASTSNLGFSICKIADGSQVFSTSSVGSVGSGAWSRDGLYFALPLPGGKIELFDVQSNEISPLASVDCSSCPHLAWSPDSSMIAVESISAGIKVYSVANKKLLAVPERAEEISKRLCKNCFDWSPDGATIVFGMEGLQLGFFDF